MVFTIGVVTGDAEEVVVCGTTGASQSVGVTSTIDGETTHPGENTFPGVWPGPAKEPPVIVVGS